MPSFKNRSYQKELLDGDAIPFEAIRQNMAELDTINHLLGGHRITLKAIRALIGSHPGKIWHITEIGCGGGDNLRVIQNWADQHHIKVVLTGIDINKECIAFAQSRVANSTIRFIQSDYRDVQFEEKPQIIFSSLFAHHFNDSDLIQQLRWMKDKCTVGFFINDLHRQPLAYYSIKILTKVFSKSYLVKHDAPLSVLRGFHRKEWQALCKQANLTSVSYQWCWAFRWLIICRK
ncbi:MAG TPA: methyltransferase domain-containing protein [Flavisolibacter sp.]|nr:methyltransferase domain-containing protein [Flavisolibacter sp.]